MKKWLILLLVALFASPVMAGQLKLRGPSRSLSSRPRISSMKDRGKPRAQVRQSTNDLRSRRGLSLSRNRPVESIIYEDHYYRPPQPIIIVVHVIVPPIPETKPIPVTVRASTHVTIFAKSTPNSRRFGASRGLIIFPEKSEAKTKP